MLTTLRHEDSSSPVLSQCLFATGRSCLVHLMRRWNPRTVHLPELLPEGLLAPFQRAKIPLFKYRLTAELEPDLDNLQKNINHTFEQSLRPLVVVVHYFGYRMPTHGPAAMAHERGGLLLEDCAHCLPDEYGEFESCADLALYSFNKMFPVVDGALLQSRTPQVHLTVPPDADSKLLPAQAIDFYRLHLAENRILASLELETPIDRRIFTETLKRSQDNYNAYYEIISNDMEPKNTITDIKACKVGTEYKKRQNGASELYFKMYKRRFRDGIPQFAFPVKSKKRDTDLKKLLDAGILATTLGDKWSCLDTEFWRSHILLPVRDVTTDDAKKIERILK